MFGVHSRFFPKDALAWMQAIGLTPSVEQTAETNQGESRQNHASAGSGEAGQADSFLSLPGYAMMRDRWAGRREPRQRHSNKSCNSQNDGVPLVVLSRLRARINSRRRWRNPRAVGNSKSGTLFAYCRDAVDRMQRLPSCEGVAALQPNTVDRGLTCLS